MINDILRSRTQTPSTSSIRLARCVSVPAPRDSSPPQPRLCIAIRSYLFLEWKLWVAGGTGFLFFFACCAVCTGPVLRRNSATRCCPQGHCTKIVDKYVEFDFIIIVIDLILHKPQVRARKYCSQRSTSHAHQKVATGGSLQLRSPFRKHAA